MTDDRPHRFTDDELRGVIADDSLSSIVMLDDFAQDLSTYVLDELGPIVDEARKP